MPTIQNTHLLSSITSRHKARGAIAVAILTGLALAPLAICANLITNGDFETGNLSGWTTFLTSNGTIGTPAVTSFDTTGAGASLAARFQVGNVSVTGAEHGGGLMQSFTTDDGLLSISANIAAFEPGNGNSGAGHFSLLLDSVVVDTAFFGSIGSNATLRDSLSYSNLVSAGTHSLQILITRSFTTSSSTPLQYVDDVVVSQELVPAAVPEPATALLGGALLGMIGLSRQRARKAAMLPA